MNTSRKCGYVGESLEWLRWAVGLDTDECLPFPFGSSSVYGFVKVDGVQLNAPRVACILAHGAAEGRHALHSCRTKRCCNKRHLRWGTHAENMLDKIRDGTSSLPSLRGEGSVTAKLTAPEVLAIRTLSRSTPTKALARRYGVSPRAIRKILQRETWSHL